jgi:hypothetical protein
MSGVGPPIHCARCHALANLCQSPLVDEFGKAVHFLAELHPIEAYGYAYPKLVSEHWIIDQVVRQIVSGPQGA